MKNKLLMTMLSCFIFEYYNCYASSEALQNNLSTSPDTVAHTEHAFCEENSECSFDVACIPLHKKKQNGFIKKKYKVKRWTLSPILIPIDEESNSFCDVKSSQILSNRIDTLFCAIKDGNFDDAAAITRDIADDGKFSVAMNKEVQESLESTYSSQRLYKSISMKDHKDLQEFDYDRMIALINATNYAGMLNSPEIKTLKEMLKKPEISDKKRRNCEKQIEFLLRPYL